MGIAGDADSLRAAIEVVEALQDAARAFARGTPGWSAEPQRLGMYIHCFPFNSVNSLHVQLVNLAAMGPTFAYHAHKNLPADAVLSVLRDELAASSLPSPGEEPNALEHAAAAQVVQSALR